MEPRTVTKEGTTYTFYRKNVRLDDLHDPSDLRPHPIPEPPSDYTTRFPSDKRPGDQIEWDEGIWDEVEGKWVTYLRNGTIIDRAPQGVARGIYCDNPCSHDKHEAGGYWFWVMPNDNRDDYVRVRYWNRGSRKGQTRREDGPMVIPNKIYNNSVTAYYAMDDHYVVVDNLKELKEKLGEHQ